ncbi:hypothetical protein CLU79DRAFT_97290 [Phycomyces nitens]|nr:hypothetical protein CLU79DRAFT_97290 [Phycomyces nitens]
MDCSASLFTSLCYAHLIILLTLPHPDVLSSREKNSFSFIFNIPKFNFPLSFKLMDASTPTPYHKNPQLFSNIFFLKTK